MWKILNHILYRNMHAGGIQVMHTKEMMWCACVVGFTSRKQATGWTHLMMQKKSQQIPTSHQRTSTRHTYSILKVLDAGDANSTTSPLLLGTLKRTGSDAQSSILYNWKYIELRSQTNTRATNQKKVSALLVLIFTTWRRKGRIILYARY